MTDKRFVAVAVDAEGEIVAERVIREGTSQEVAGNYARLMPVAYADRGAVSWALWTLDGLRDHRLRILAAASV